MASEPQPPQLPPLTDPFAAMQWQQTVQALRKAALQVPRSAQPPHMSDADFMACLSRVLHATVRTVVDCDANPRHAVPQALARVVSHAMGRHVRHVLPALHPPRAVVFELAPRAIADEPLVVAYPDKLTLLLQQLGHKVGLPPSLNTAEQQLFTWTLLDDIRHHEQQFPATHDAVSMVRTLRTARPARALQTLRRMEHATAQAQHARTAADASRRVARAGKHDVAELAMLAQLGIGLGGDLVTSLARDAELWVTRITAMPGAAQALASITEAKCNALLEAAQARWRMGALKAASVVAMLREQRAVGHDLGPGADGLSSGSSVATSLPALSLSTIAKFGVPQLLAWWGVRVAHTVRWAP